METYFNEDIYNILEIVGEQEKLNITIQCLKNLIDWCELCYNNEIEEQDAKKLHKAMEILQEVKTSYEINYN